MCYKAPNRLNMTVSHCSKTQPFNHGTVPHACAIRCLVEMLLKGATNQGTN